MPSLIKEAENIVKNSGLGSLGVSGWKEYCWWALEELGYTPYAISVLISWDTSQDILKKGNPDVNIRVADEKNMDDLRVIQKSSWGFFIPPNFRREHVLIAYYGGKPVGSAYLNKYTGNIDFGVHVVKEYQRMRIGAAILEEVLKYFRSRGFKRMFVVRKLRAITKINESDKVALKFYVNCGGTILREYRGFRVKKYRRNIKVLRAKELL